MPQASWHNIMHMGAEELYTRLTDNPFFTADDCEDDPTNFVPFDDEAEAEEECLHRAEKMREGVDNLNDFQDDIERLWSAAGDSLRFPVYRAIRVPSIRQVQWGNVGSCWAYEEEGARAYQQAGHYPPEWSGPLRLHVLRGTVDVDDIDWHKTALNKIQYPQEFEIRLKPMASIHVTGYRIGRIHAHEDLSDADLQWRSFSKHLVASVHEYCGRDMWRPRK